MKLKVFSGGFFGNLSDFKEELERGGKKRVVGKGGIPIINLRLPRFIE